MCSSHGPAFGAGGWLLIATGSIELSKAAILGFAVPARQAGPSYIENRLQKRLMSTVNTNQFKNGNHIDVEGTIFKILEFQHVKPGKGGAFVRTKLRRATDGNVIDRTFRAGEKFRAVRTEARKMQFLYADGTDAHFMDTESFEQLAVAESSFSEVLRWIKPSSEVDVLFIDDQPSDVQLPSGVDLEVTETEPGLRGDTASGGGTKPATLETGAIVQVPLFVSVGERVRVDTRSGEYVSRA
jgi:elongation factor P